MNNEHIKEKLKKLPMAPGVYLMKNSDGSIIYVGKSKVLKNRVNQYFQNTSSHSPKTLAMVEKVYDFDYILTDTEAEALALECNLIKKYRPRYNILLKDDKQYPYIKITLNEDFPRIMMTRKTEKDGAIYFGPYMSGYMVKDTLDIIKKLFRVRSCKKNLPKDIGKGRPCLLYHLNQCSAPCDGKISKAEYRKIFDQIEMFLKGDSKEIIKKLEKNMYLASEKMEFEKASAYRDKIESIKSLSEKQKITSSKDGSRDVIGLYSENEESCIQIFYVRDGKVIETEHYIFQSNSALSSETIEAFIKQFYYSSTSIPKEILITATFDEIEDVEQWLGENCSHKVRIYAPKKGEKLKLVEMVNKNAEESYKLYKFKRDKDETDRNEILSKLKETLNLKSTPYRIESYDISNISGANSVGAEIVYINAKPSRKEYRKFNIKTVSGADDYLSMQEVIRRRISESYIEEEKIASDELKKGKEKFLPRPDLILLDGGKGHVSAVKETLKLFNEDIPVFGLVKDNKHQTRGITDENSEIPIPKDGELFKFISCMQDEVHRFAITSFRKRHERTAVSSELENIPGIGEIRRKKLLKYFGNIETIKKTSKEELEIILDKRSAESIFNHFHK